MVNRIHNNRLFVTSLQFSNYSCWNTDYQRVFGDVMGYHRACPGDAASADFHRRDQHGIAANKHLIANFSWIFYFTIKIAGDGPRTNIDVFANFRIADIGKVSHPGTRS